MNRSWWTFAIAKPLRSSHFNSAFVVSLHVGPVVAYTWLNQLKCFHKVSSNSPADSFSLDPLCFFSACQPSPLQASLSCLFGFCITAVKSYKCFDPQCLEKRPKNTTWFSGPNWSLWVCWSVTGTISLLHSHSRSDLQLQWKCQQRMKQRPWSSSIFEANEWVWYRNSHVYKRSRQNNSSVGWLKSHSEELPQAACVPQRALAMAGDLCQHRLMVTAQNSTQVLMITPLPHKNLNPAFLAWPPADSVMKSKTFILTHSYLPSYCSSKPK